MMLYYHSEILPSRLPLYGLSTNGSDAKNRVARLGCSDWLCSTASHPFQQIQQEVPDSLGSPPVFARALLTRKAFSRFILMQPP